MMLIIFTLLDTVNLNLPTMGLKRISYSITLKWSPHWYIITILNLLDFCFILDTIHIS